MSSEADVVIIGAGASGLSAAKELARMGLSYVVIEGSHRIGGRAYSEEIAPEVWFDLGCSYLHQGDTNPFVAIADELGVVLGKDKGEIFTDDRLGIYNNGMTLNPDERKAFFSVKTSGMSRFMPPRVAARMWRLPIWWIWKIYTP